MTTITFFTTMVVMLHVAHSYILVSANIDDVKAIAKQIAQSPIVSEIDKLFRRHFRRKLTDADYEADNQDFRRSSNKTDVKKDSIETHPDTKNDGDRPEASAGQDQIPLKVTNTSAYLKPFDKVLD